MQLKEAEEKILKDKVDILIKGNRPTKDFFSALKRKSDFQSKFITGLTSTGNVFKSDPQGILSVAYEYYCNLFSEKEMHADPNLENAYFENVKKVPEGLGFFEWLTGKITVEEVWDVLISFLEGKTPGPDGLSLEFYKVVFPIIKHDLVRLFNTFYDSAFIPAKSKAGFITLIAKREPFDDIENYRPISLINVDLKIYSKILCLRLKPVLPYILHDTQYGYASKNINQVTTLIRDIENDMKSNRFNDSFFVSVDFFKAFDNVDHNFIVKVLKWMNFPEKFINAVVSLMHMASSQLFINGHLSKKFKIKSGIRQGCPMSKDVFNIIINPLIVFLEHCCAIQKYTTLSNHKFLTLSYVDDLNLFVNALTSLLNAIYYINRFKDISGLKLNVLKTKGIFYNNRLVFSPSDLPRSIIWVKDLKVLGIHFGTAEWIASQWEDLYNMFKGDIGYYKTILSTLDAKAMVSKFKLFSIFSYVAGVYPLPPKINEKIEKDLMNFVVPHKRTFLSLSDVASPRVYGGYDFDNIPLHAKIMLIKPLMGYFQHRLRGDPLTTELSFIEYNVGLQMITRYGLETNNLVLHAFEPNQIYKDMLTILSKFKITADELGKGSVIGIYKRIICEGGPHTGHELGYYKLHRKIFPSYLKSFNYRLHFDLLPVKAKFQHFSLHSNSGCTFCSLHPETSVHLFAKCPSLYPLWDFLDDALNATFLNQCRYSFRDSRVRKYDYSLVNLKCKPEYERLLLYLNAIVNTNIWKWRNKIKHDNVQFDISHVKASFIRSLVSRKNIEKSDRLRHCHKVDYIESYCYAICSIRDATYDPG